MLHLYEEVCDDDPGSLPGAKLHLYEEVRHDDHGRLPGAKMGCRMNLQSLWVMLKQNGVPLSKAVPFLADLADVALADVAGELGCNKSTLYRALDARAPKPELCEAINQALGFDLWDLDNADPATILNSLRRAGVPMHRAVAMLATDRGVVLDSAQLRLVRVGSVTSEDRLGVTRLLGADPWEIYSVRPIDTRTLLQALKEDGVPMQKSVAMLCDLAGSTLAAIARQAGCRRNTAYAAMRGEFAPPDALREAMLARLGIDPWEVYPCRKPRVGRKATVGQQVERP